MHALLLLALLPGFAFGEGCENYCVGIRGNGEAVPAHWAALARMVEENGMPKSTAGGSSATVTMFLLDSLSGNAKVKAERDAVKKRKMQALMLKSMPEFTALMVKDSKIAEGLGMIRALGGADPELRKKAIEAFGHAGSLSPAELKMALGKYGALLNPELAANVKRDPLKFGPEAKAAIENLGKFNAVTDDNLFFRPGLVDFKGLAVTMGYMADFYAGNTDPETKAKLDSFLSECAESAYQKNWGEVPAAECRERFQKIAADYLRAGNFQHKAIFQKVGTNTSTLPTTSVIEGDSVGRYQAAKAAYERGDFSAMKEFSVDPKDIRVGYWGRLDDLKKVSNGFAGARKEGDFKATKFRSLGRGNWFDVIATSPAEPGIANVQKIPFEITPEIVRREMKLPLEERWKNIPYLKNVLSAGGWSDLHPTSVLKAKGCSPAIYLTRQSAPGDSVFAQQILIRLAGEKEKVPFWPDLGKGTHKGWCEEQIREAGGDPAQVANTLWAKNSNLCNPQSSFRRALDQADGSYCTDWNNEKNSVFKGQLGALTKDAYEAPLIPTSPAGLACQLNQGPDVPDPSNLPSCVPFVKRSPGFPRPAPGSAAPIPEGEGNEVVTPAK